MIDSTLVGALCGFSASLAPDVMSMIKSQQEHTQLLAEKRLELEAAEKDHVFQTDIRNIRSATDELKVLLEHDTGLATDNPIIAALRASVRPVVTYLFVFLFMLVKVTTLWQWVAVDHLPLTVAVPMLWNDDTMSIFAAVLSFWFGSRALSQYRGVINNRITRRRA